jgi:hypothetical protein
MAFLKFKEIAQTPYIKGFWKVERNNMTKCKLKLLGLLSIQQKFG